MQKRKRQILAVLLLGCLLFSACGAPETETAGGTEPPAESETAPLQTETETLPAADTGTEKAGKPCTNPSSLLEDGGAGASLPEIRITVPDGGALNRNKTYHEMTFSVCGSAGGEDDFSPVPGQIRCRGNATFTAMPKKSYRIKLAEAKNLFHQDTGKAKDWILLAEYGDRSFLRNHAAMAIAEVLGIPHSSSSFVKLYINGEYAGVYHLMEQAECKKSRVPLVAADGTTDTDVLVELDSYAPREGEKNKDYFTVNGKAYAIKDPDPSYELCGEVRERFREAETALQQGDRDAIEALLDVPSFVDMYLLQALAKNMDCGWSSFYYAVPLDGKISCVWPWDFDIAFGSDGRLDDGRAPGLYVGDWSYSRLDQFNTWFGYLMRCRWFVDLVRERWDEAGEAAYLEAANEIGRIFSCFGNELEENFAKWNNFGSKVNVEPEDVRTLPDFESHVGQLLSWLEERYEWLDAYFSDPDLAYRTVR